MKVRINSKDDYETFKGITPGGVSSPVRAFEPFPIVIDSGNGCHITDVDGNEYIDLCMAYGPMIVGHSCPRVIKAVEDQIRKGSVFGCPSEPEMELLQRIVSTVPSAEMCRLSNSGTEATMHAVRLARGYTERNGIVKINGGFHGAHNTMLVAAGSGSVNGTPNSLGIPVDDVRNTYIVEFNDASSFESLLDRNEDIAAVIMEPVMGNVGVVPPKNGYLGEMRKITERHDVLLIFDEVITGFRVSAKSAQGYYGITPDLTTMGKVIGGGYPAGAFMGKKRIMDMVAPAGPVYAAGTFAGNPISAVAGLETIKIMAEKDRYEELERKTGDLVAHMRDSLDDSGIEGCVQTVSSMFSICFGADEIRNGTDAQKVDRAAFRRMFNYMLDRGVYLPPGPMEVEFMSAATGRETCDEIAAAFDGFLRQERGR